MRNREASLPFDLRSLEVFLAVCEAGAMSAAARNLGQTQPAVSQIVADIEARLGATLFDRKVRPLTVTAAGELLRQHAYSLLADARKIAPLVREIQAGKLSSIRIGIVDSLWRSLTARLSADLAKVAEHVTLLSGLTSAHITAFLTRKLDVVLGLDDLGDMDGVERWPVFDEPHILLVPAVPEIPTEPADLMELADRLPFIRFSARSGTGQDIDRHLRRLGLEIRRTYEFDTPYGVSASVAAGHGWAITTPLCLYEANVPLQGLHCIPLPGPSLRRRLTLIARRQELGNVPIELARSVRHTLSEECLTYVSSNFPWLRGQIIIPSSHS